MKKETLTCDICHLTLYTKYFSIMLSVRGSPETHEPPTEINYNEICGTCKNVLMTTLEPNKIIKSE